MIMELTELLKKLCELDGVSGNEKTVRDFICSYIDGKCEYTVDRLGSIIAFKKGRKTPDKKLLISAHMDEVGFIVTYISDEGAIKIAEVGGIDPRVVYGKRVRVGDNRILGVIGGKAIHNLTSDERGKVSEISQMFVDIGTDAESVKKCVSIGDTVVFDSQYLTFGNRFIKSKAIDDRAGCAIMMKLIDEGLEYDTYFTFVVQEEVGLRGAKAASFAVAPDMAVVLEATTASDIPSSSGEKRVCEVNKGPVISYMDRHTIYDRELYKLAFSAAEELNIPCQTKTVVAGGNDAGAISTARGGVRTIAISLPCRYLHSPSCVISENDLGNTYTLTKKLLERMHE